MYRRRMFAVAACLALLAATTTTGVRVGAARAASCAFASRFAGATRAFAGQRRRKSRARRVKIVRQREGDVVEGVWGGAHLRLHVRAGGAELEFDCARGEITAPFKTDAEGRFDLPGTFMREGGSIRIGKTPTARPARYRGQVEGRTMTLSLRLTETDQTLDTFTLARGSEGRLWKCR